MFQTKQKCLLDETKPWRAYKHTYEYLLKKSYLW